MNDLTKLIVAVGIVFLLAYGLAGCASNPCVDNPRMMSCMSVDELERELNAI